MTITKALNDKCCELLMTNSILLNDGNGVNE